MSHICILFYPVLPRWLKGFRLQEKVGDVFLLVESSNYTFINHIHMHRVSYFISYFKPNPYVVASVTELFKQSQRMVNLPLSGISQPLFPWILLTLWTSRNRMVFEEKIFNEREVILKAIKDGREWQVAQPLKPPTTSPTPPPQLRNVV